MDTLPDASALRAIHAPDLTPMREALTDYLCAWLGGPGHYFDRPDAKCIRSTHSPYPIGQKLRDEWLLCMEHAMDGCGDLSALTGDTASGFRPDGGPLAQRRLNGSGRGPSNGEPATSARGSQAEEAP